MYGFLLLFNSNLSVSRGQNSFWDIRHKKCCDLENRDKGPWRSLKMSSHRTPYRRWIATIGLSRTVSEINGDFGRKFFPPRVFCAPLKGFPLELDIGAGGQKTRVMGLPGGERSLKISSAVWIDYTNVTDGRTDTGQQQRMRLCIASRGKNH